jgi:beta-barrel assembly-enhancing protease
VYMPSSLGAKVRQSRLLVWGTLGVETCLFVLLLVPFLWFGRASAQNASPPESKASHNDSTAAILNIHVRHNVPFKYDINHIAERGIGSEPNRYSLEREQKLGHDLAREIEMQRKLGTDRVITEYVNRLGQRLVRNSDARIPFNFRVIESNEISAFALPGGYIYLNTGLILATDNEAELAGVMAHEVAHVAARHVTRRETRMQIWRHACVPLRFAGPFGSFGMMLQTAMFMKFGRDEEREADLLGLEYQYVAGYDPQTFVQFFERLHVKEKERQNLVSKAFDTHPMMEERIRRAQEEISTLLPEKTEYVLDTGEFQEIKTRLARLIVEDTHPVGQRHDPEEGKRTGGNLLRRGAF